MTGFAGPWEAVVDWLAAYGGPPVFGLPGDDLAALTALEGTDLRLVLCRDQRAAVFMATGWALAAGRFGVCLVGKGPAVSNAITGLLEAHTSGVPLVLLAGGTGADRLGAGAFQELDQLALVRPLTRWAHRVEDPARLPAALEKAAAIATAGVPGPVYLEIPDHLLGRPVPARPWAALPVRLPSAASTGAPAAIRAARRPVLLVGGGLRGRNDDRVLERFAERIGAAVFATASGRGAYDERHPAFCGLAGLYTPIPARRLWRETDLVIALATRLEETATYPPGFAGPGVPVLQLNLDAAGLSAEYPGPRLIGEAASTVAGWLSEMDSANTDPQWTDLIHRVRAEVWAGAEDRLAATADRITVAGVLAELDHALGPDRILVQENGLQDMWSYFYPQWTCGQGSGSIVPSEQTSLGFGAAAAGGAALAAPGRTVVALVGDGAFAMVGNDVLTLAREGIPVLYVVLRNGGYGWLQRQLDARGGPTRFRFRHPGEELPVPRHPNLRHAVVTDRASLPGAIGDALVACGKGGVAVVEVEVSLDDVADEIAELDTGEHA
jgi:acetolactate synthase-1/2/3 large subunit